MLRAGDLSTRDKESPIYSEQVGLLYKNVLIGLTATLINSLLLGSILYGTIASGMIAAWLGCLLPVTLLRFISMLEYKHSPAQSRTGISWDTLFLIGATCAGIIWGSAGVLLFPEQSMSHQIFLAFVLGGMAAGGAVVYSPVKPVFLTFILLDLAPITIRFCAEGDRPHITMGMMLTLFIVMMLFAAMQMHRVIVESLFLRFKNDTLVTHLKAAKESSEKLVEELQLSIAERDRAEEARQSSERQFRMLVETMNEGLGVYDETGSITYVNDRACKISNYSRDELLGQDVALFFGEANRSIYEEQWARREKGEKDVYEVDLVGKGGHIIPAIVSSSPIFDQNGRFNGSIVSVTDISSLKEARRAQRESESKYRLIFENSPLGVVHMNFRTLDLD